jgi:Tfp pilus assembly pilus retraction ATPase PilT
MPTETEKVLIPAVREQVVAMISNKPEVSDIHLIQDDYVMYRINGEIARQTQRLQTSKDRMNQIISILLNNEVSRIALFHEKKELDF